MSKNITKMRLFFIIGILLGFYGFVYAIDYQSPFLTLEFLFIGLYSYLAHTICELEEIK